MHLLVLLLAEHCFYKVGHYSTLLTQASFPLLPLLNMNSTEEQIVINVDTP